MIYNFVVLYYIDWGSFKSSQDSRLKMKMLTVYLFLFWQHRHDHGDDEDFRNLLHYCGNDNQWKKVETFFFLSLHSPILSGNLNEPAELFR